MIEGQTIKADSQNQRVYLTPWFPRQSDNAVFTYEQIHSSLGLGEVVTVLHKAAEDSGTGAAPTGGGFAELGTGTGIWEATASDLKELVRFQITLKQTTGSLHFRFLPPTWFATAKA